MEGVNSEQTMPEVNLAVISDLHCRLATDPRESFLTVGGARKPSNRHPVESCIDLIQKEQLRADALLLPGDFANRASLEGLSQGWDYSVELGRHLQVKALVPTIGNHDIDSHRQRLEPVFDAVRNMRVDFPFAEEAENRRFFSDGYALVHLPGLDVVVINTVIDQTDANSAKRGTFGLTRIQQMEQEVASKLHAPVRVALMHHHPLLHSGTFLEDTDVLPTGDHLLAALRRIGCRLVIHGHKHFARLTYIDQLAVMASGSFSAQLFEYASSMGNTFHMVRLEGNEVAAVKGQIRTWVFRLGQGWKEAHEDRDGIPFLSGFGRRSSITDIVTALTTLGSNDGQRDRFIQTQVEEVAPDIAYLTPSEREEINRSLRLANLRLGSFLNGKLELWREFNP
jgi:predicted phosphodiesterase